MMNFCLAENYDELLTNSTFLEHELLITPANTRSNINDVFKYCLTKLEHFFILPHLDWSPVPETAINRKRKSSIDDATDCLKVNCIINAIYTLEFFCTRQKFLPLYDILESQTNHAILNSYDRKSVFQAFQKLSPSTVYTDRFIHSRMTTQPEIAMFQHKLQTQLVLNHLHKTKIYSTFTRSPFDELLYSIATNHANNIYKDKQKLKSKLRDLLNSIIEIEENWTQNTSFLEKILYENAKENIFHSRRLINFLSSTDPAYFGEGDIHTILSDLVGYCTIPLTFRMCAYTYYLEMIVQVKPDWNSIRFKLPVLFMTFLISLLHGCENDINKTINHLTNYIGAHEDLFLHPSFTNEEKNLLNQNIECLITSLCDQLTREEIIQNLLQPIFFSLNRPRIQNDYTFKAPIWNPTETRSEYSVAQNYILFCQAKESNLTNILFPSE